MSASDELERLAVQYASEAIQLDKQGSPTLAVRKYERAVELLLKLCSLYPDAPQNRVYLEHADGYRRRIKELGQHDVHRELRSTHSESGSTLQAQQLLLPSKPDVRWDDIVDLHEAKKGIEESVMYPVRRPDLFPLGWPRGILFFGPPGCGKTLLAAAVATEIEASFYSIDAASIMSKWLGESEKNVAQVFDGARQAASEGKPSILFIDEVDSLVGIRAQEVGGEIRTRNQFLKEMDSLLDKKKNILVYVIGATNKPWVLDEPFIRRFQKRIFVPLPPADARLEMLRMYTRELSLAPDVDSVQLAKETEGYSGSDMRDIVQSAQIKVVREFFELGSENNGRTRSVTMNDFREIIDTRKPSVSQDTLRYYQTWFNKFGAL